MIHMLLEWLLQHPPGDWVYVVLAAIAFVETLFPPFPGDVLFVVVSGWCGGGAFPAAVSTAAGTAGCLAGIVILIAAGRTMGSSRARAFLNRHLGEQRASRAESLIRRRGGPVLLASRFVPGIRSALVLVAGYSGMKPASAVCWAGGSALAWYAILSATGAALGWNLAGVEAVMRSYEIWFWVILSVVLAIGFLAGSAARRRK